MFKFPPRLVVVVVTASGTVCVVSVLDCVVLDMCVCVCVCVCVCEVQDPMSGCVCAVCLPANQLDRPRPRDVGRHPGRRRRRR